MCREWLFERKCKVKLITRAEKEREKGLESENQGPKLGCVNVLAGTKGGKNSLRMRGSLGDFQIIVSGLWMWECVLALMKGIRYLHGWWIKVPFGGKYLSCSGQICYSYMYLYVKPSFTSSPLHYHHLPFNFIICLLINHKEGHFCGTLPKKSHLELFADSISLSPSGVILPRPPST